MSPTQSENKDLILLFKEKKRSAGLGGPQEDRIRVECKVTPGKAHESQEPLQVAGPVPGRRQGRTAGAQGKGLAWEMGCKVGGGLTAQAAG